MKTFVERHAAKIRGTLSCFDRVVITGTLPDIAHAGAMAAYLTARQVRLFDYPQWAAPLREDIRAHAEQVAREAGLTIDFIQRKDFRKEARIKAILAERGDHPGPVHVFSAMEPCPSFRPWHDKLTSRTLLTDRGQVPALRLLLPRSGVRAVLPARADLGALPPAVLLQRP
jgi:hypothetical protein